MFVEFSLRIFVVFAVSLDAISAVAQNIFGDPFFGSIDLQAGFSPDPYVKHVNAGGGTEFSSCTGYFSADPDLNLVYEAGDYVLGIFAKSDVDTTIAINDPSGDWFCSDDSDHLRDANPGVQFNSPESGIYNIWVGVYSESSAYESANLVITELGSEDWDTLELNESEPFEIELNVTGDPSYGVINLESGFLPDPNVTDILIGGSFQLDEPGCPGYFSSDPDINLNYEASNLTELGIFAVSEVDSTIAIHGPNGRWFCNDDSTYMNGINPAVLFENPSSGRYSIWLGSYYRDDALEQRASLVITELNADDWAAMDLIDDGSSSPGLDIYADPSFDTINLERGFAPDPYTAEVLAGGDAVSLNCAGLFSSAPHVNLNYGGEGPSLSFVTESTADTTLAIYDANGEWHCNDDAEPLANNNAGLTILNPTSGSYKVWVGTFSSDDALEVESVLFITSFSTIYWDELGELVMPSVVQFGRKDSQ